MTEQIEILNLFMDSDWLEFGWALIFAFFVFEKIIDLFDYIFDKILKLLSKGLKIIYKLIKKKIKITII